MRQGGRTLRADTARAGLPERDQHRAGRAELLTSFVTFEERIRNLHDRMPGSGGLRVGARRHRDHGQSLAARLCLPLFDPDWPKGQAPHELGRARFGPIAIANFHAAAAAYTDVAIDQAHRAVQELLAGWVAAIRKEGPAVRIRLPPAASLRTIGS